MVVLCLFVVFLGQIAAACGFKPQGLRGMAVLAVMLIKVCDGYVTVLSYPVRYWHIGVRVTNREKESCQEYDESSNHYVNSQYRQ